MPTKCCWVIYGRLTSERKASTSPSSFINHSTLLLSRALKRQAPLLYMHFEHSTGSERVDAKGRRAVEVIICMITRDFRVISMTSQASLSLSLSLSLSQKSLTHNIGSASALPIISSLSSFLSRSLILWTLPSSVQLMCKSLRLLKSHMHFCGLFFFFFFRLSSFFSFLF